MSRRPVQQQITELSEKAVALTILVEALWASLLAEHPDPAKAGNEIIDELFRRQAQSWGEVGKNSLVLQISDAMTALIDRVVTAALVQRSTRLRR